MRIVIDTKNLALYGGGIAHWFSPLLAAWIAHRPDARFLLVGPGFNTDFLPQAHNWEHVPLPWPEWLPRTLRHPWYDNVLFPGAVSRLHPDLAMSPYHDVRMPKGVPCVIGVHDLCMEELGSVYPRRIRAYYLALLRLNLRRAALVITVSETSRSKLIERYGMAPERVEVVYNTPPAAFEAPAEPTAIADFRQRYGTAGHLLFYPGGSEYRKNITRLVQGFVRLAQRNNDLILLVTGQQDPRWNTVLTEIPEPLRQHVMFTGTLSDAELQVAYAAADAVVYPSLCEGFGRVCLEAMVTGTPLACSDLPVMREVAGDYAQYFDPFDVESITDAVAATLSRGRCEPVRDALFQGSVVKESFMRSMARFFEGIYPN